MLVKFGASGITVVLEISNPLYIAAIKDLQDDELGVREYLDSTISSILLDESSKKEDLSRTRNSRREK